MKTLRWLWEGTQTLGLLVYSVAKGIFWRGK